MKTRVEEVRDIAIEHHHQEVGTFRDWYEQLKVNRYASAFGYGRHKIDVELDQVFKSLPAGARILDVGCGTGEYLVTGRGFGFKVAGLEPAEGMRVRAIEQNPGADVQSGVATALPWADGQFDLVICIEVLRYLHRDDVRLALSEMRRVLKPGGVLFLTMVNRYAADGFWLHYQLKRLVRRGRVTTDAPHCEFVTPAEMATELSRVGFTQVENKGVLFAPLRLLYKVSERAAAHVARAVEPVDDALSRVPWTTPFAGHLIVLAKS